MYSIRFHGRGGQGMKTASRLLGTAFFLEGFEVQDAPRYGAERRGAPMSAYVRADHRPIHARGIIDHPGLIVVADETLIPIPAAGVLDGLHEATVMLISSRESERTWRGRLNIDNPVLTVPPTDAADIPLISASCAGAAACLTGVISPASLCRAIAEELQGLDPELLERNQKAARESYEALLPQRGLVREIPGQSPDSYSRPAWIDLPLEPAEIASPTIHGELTSILVHTGLWRTRRPVIDYSRCHHCWWICSSSCPDGVIDVIAMGRDNVPSIDYDHCKGCMICVAQCPSHAIGIISEAEAAAREQEDSE